MWISPAAGDRSTGAGYGGYPGYAEADARPGTLAEAGGHQQTCASKMVILW